MPMIIELVCKKSCYVQKKFLSEKDGNFIIEHYSGPVAYSIEDLLSKNTDKVLDIFCSLLQTLIISFFVGSK